MSYGLYFCFVSLKEVDIVTWILKYIVCKFFVVNKLKETAGIISIDRRGRSTTMYVHACTHCRTSCACMVLVPNILILCEYILLLPYN
jgi:hypothetical protein